MAILKEFLLLIILGISHASVINNRVNDKGCQLSTQLKSEIQGYQETVNKIIDTIVNGQFKGDTYESLAKFTDTFGPRFSGTEALEKSIDYLVKEFASKGLENVHTEVAPVTHWMRGVEKATLIQPRKTNLPILGLGHSVGTPIGGIQAEVIVVESFDELNSIPDEKIKGKIVLWVPKWVSYGQTVRYRNNGASEASKRGAIASLVKSITPFSIGSLHAGSQNYQAGVRKIPTAAITVEDAEFLQRVYRRGDKIVVHLEMQDSNQLPVASRNTIGELTGSVYKNTSVVVLSGHIDSWDVGVGAMDDGGGAFISWKAVQYLKAMGLRPKRTIRAIMWTDEEEGYNGARQYEKDHKSKEREEFNIFIESDTGTFDPRGLGFSGTNEAECIFREIVNLMGKLNATEVGTDSSGGPDISLWTNRGFPGADLLNKNERYFWFHHTAGDSMTVESSSSLDRNTALFAATAYVIADLSQDLPRDVKN